MARPVTGSNAPDYDSWDAANDSAAAAKPQLVDPTKLTVGEDVQVPPSPGQLEGAEPDSVSKAQSGLPPAPLTDPLDKSALQAILGAKPQLPLDEGAIKDIFAKAGGSVMYADGVKGTGSGTATKLAGGPKVSAEVADLIDRGTKINTSSKDKDTQQAEKDTRAEFSTAQKAIAAGDYTKAYQCMEKLLRKQGEEVLEPADVKSTETVRDQLQFLSKMQQAGIKADFPPTEAQLVDYFKTLKNNPAAAVQAFQDYTKLFHVHPVNVKGADFDIPYSPETVRYGKGDYPTTAPHDWSEVANRPVAVKDYPQYIGKQMNDCQGFGFMAAKLLGAAGFKVENYVSVFPGPHGISHDMVLFTHPPEKGYTLTSNDGVFQGNKAIEVAKKGFEYAAGKANVTGKEHFWTGKTMAESQVQMVIKDNELK